MTENAPHLEALKARLLAMREATRRRALALEARYRRRRHPMEQALQEFARSLEYLRKQGEEGRYPASLLRPALMREELRLKHLEAELARLEEGFKKEQALLWAKVRTRAARVLARAGVNLDLDEFFPEGRS